MAEKFEILTIPTLIIFKDKKEVKRIIGFNEDEYHSLINESLKKFNKN